MTSWQIFQGTGSPHEGVKELVPAPPWRSFGTNNQSPNVHEDLREHSLLLEVDPDLARRFRHGRFLASPQQIDIVNAAICLRRPLLVTGNPGTGKTTLAYAIAHELMLGKVLAWPITSHSRLKDAQYQYDAIGRLHDANLPKNSNSGVAPDIGDYIRLGPLGTALLPRQYPRVLLIDEIDKSDIDLPNELLHVFELGKFEIPELKRLSTKSKGDEGTDIVEVYEHDSDNRPQISQGEVQCDAFPIVVLTSNGEREFPPAFLRRCIRLNLPDPNDSKLDEIVKAYFDDDELLTESKLTGLVRIFLAQRKKGGLATDQLLNAVYLTKLGGQLVDEAGEEKDVLIQTILKNLS